MLTGESILNMNQLPNARMLAIRWVAPLTLAVIGSMMVAEKAEAQNFGINGFQPFGFYQPYGVRYRSSVATPPYFSVNPPIYYGTRHYRPYGISPFATPPQVTAPPNYHGQPGSSGLRSRHYTGPVGNPFICRSDDQSGDQPTLTETVSAKRSVPSIQLGKVQTNPFVEPEAYLAQR